MTLFPVRGRNGFCGPAVLSALTGFTTDESARLLRAVSGSRAVRGVTPPQMILALQALRFSVQRYLAVPPDLRPYPLGEWLDRVPALEGAWLIATDSVVDGASLGHFQVVAGGELACSYYRDPVRLHKVRKRHRRQSLLAVWYVTMNWFPVA